MSRIGGVLAAILAVLGAACTTTRPAPPSDRFPLDPREGLAGPFAPEVESGWRALADGDGARAAGDFERARVAGGGPAADAGLVEALVLEGAIRRAVDACVGPLADPRPTAALLSACGEAHARAEEPVEAFELYARAAGLPPERAGIVARREDLRKLAVARLSETARAAADRKDWNAAHDAAARAVAADPQSAPAREVAGDVAAASGDSAAALDSYRQALERAPGDTNLQRKVAELAVEASDWGAAIPALDALAAKDPSWEPKAATARLSFRVANWPEAERAAARSPRLTRGQAARLLWWMLPEVREARVTSGRIASDVLDRSDSREVVRAVSLGLLDVDADTHRARPDAVLSFGSAAKLYVRLLELLAGKRPACVGGRSLDVLASEEAVRLARACGAIREDDGPPVSGAGFTRTLDRVRSLAAKGPAAPGDGAAPWKGAR